MHPTDPTDHRQTPRVLSIAGTDPTGGAGIQADLKSIAANGGYGMAVVTALVAQNTMGVRSVHIPPVEFLTEQLDSVSDDVEIDAVKIGMLANSTIIEAVADWLRRQRPPVVVLDPVMVATSGDRLLDERAVDAILDLVRHADLVTPNIPELAVLADEPTVSRWNDVLEQAHRVSATYGVTVLAKGGHLADGSASDALVDAGGRLSGGRDLFEFPGERIETTNTHGTGCSLSSALATLRPQAPGWEHAVDRAKRWLTESITHGAALRVGHGNGPISHFAGLWAGQDGAWS
ncbi:bifunctional hydroxymethylpyrimidine kinase/phosphomethylpyrimidine kinase [Polymorphospora sp. NPDC051019]|uniref:bifunctional hydroxymethylpyrimidine kinase/phosphomethylpyrimidine kinase n=1 Tax=Polymorphospora sp. NPDC051019 TaxID=3155725 RepID=UPI00342DD6C1